MIFVHYIKSFDLINIVLNFRLFRSEKNNNEKNKIEFNKEQKTHLPIRVPISPNR